jgi:hypothetical protein
MIYAVRYDMKICESQCYKHLTRIDGKSRAIKVIITLYILGNYLNRYSRLTSRGMPANHIHAIVGGWVQHET